MRIFETVVPFNINRHGSQKEAFTEASVLAMDPGNALPEVSCQVIKLLFGTCSSKKSCQNCIGISEAESWTTFMVAALPSAFR